MDRLFEQMENLKEKEKPTELSTEKHIWRPQQRQSASPPAPIPEKPTTRPEPEPTSAAITGEQAIPPPPKDIISKGPEPAPYSNPIEKEPLPLRPEPYLKKKKWPAGEDMEEFIGGNLANKLGIGILILGISFFVKYAIDKNWINELGRVSIGLLCGTILIGIAHRMHKKYRAFSSVLVGGGLAVLYFSIAFAFHQYQLIGQQAAFVIMMLTTAFAVVLSLYYNRQEIAIIALVGGFATPFLASTGNDNYIALFIYLLILCSGMMVLAWFRRWPAINIISMIGTAIIYGGWLINKTWLEVSESFPYQHALLFGTAFFLIFMTMHILNNLRMQRRFKGMDYVLVISTQLAYFTSALVCLSYATSYDWDAGFTLLLGIFNLSLAGICRRFWKTDPNFVWLLLALSLTWFTICIFIQFNGYQISMFWAAEAILLMALAARTRIKLLFRSSKLVHILAVIAMIVNWSDAYLFTDEARRVILNAEFISSVFVGISFFAIQYIQRHYKLEELSPLWTKYDQFSSSHVIWGSGILFITGLLEIMFQFDHAFPEAPVFQLYVQLYLVVFGILLLILLRKNPIYPALLRWSNMGSFLMLVLYASTNINIQPYLIDNGLYAHFLTHWLTFTLQVLLFVLLISYYSKQPVTEWRPLMARMGVVVCAALLFSISLELYQVNWSIHLFNPEDTNKWDTLYYKAQLSILWGLFAFVLIWQGLKHRIRLLRVISLFLFGITLCKLFLYDIRNIPPGGKIASFILLGILLLVISFLYQRIKKIILD
jgi:uncharacterized membrane protein